MQLRPCALGALLCLLASAIATAQPVVTFSGPNMRLRSATVTGQTPRYTIRATMENDNANGSLATSWRRWWHFEVANTARTTLDVRIENAGYSDVILPVWSLSNDNGATWGPYVRVPTSATPVVSGTTHSFTLVVPTGITRLRLAKYFPYQVADKDALLARVRNHPSGHVRSVRSLGTSLQGRSIDLIELTDSTEPDAGKRRVWIHSGIHPAETTSYFAVEGLIDFLLSGSPRSELLLDRLIVDIVPMANPDGVFLGNYRTNSRSVNLEDEWVAPYSSPEREIVALRTEIERLMGTAQSPGSNPIEVLLNLHGSHNVAYPFHFEHVSNPNFDLVTSRSGVIPPVNQKERTWIAALRNQSPFVARGTTQSSTLSAPLRPFVESMMHDRWSIDPQWTGAPNHLEEVMAITLEGTYGRGPDGVSWNTAADYALLGAEIGNALGEYFALLPGGTVTTYGTSCRGPNLGANLLAGPERISFTSLGGAPNAPAWLVIGTTRTDVPLPPPTLCSLRTDLVIVVGAATNGVGLWQSTIPIPASVTALRFKSQFIVAEIAGSVVQWQSSNGLDVLWLR